MFYRIADLAAITGTSSEVVTEAATILNKRIVGGVLSFHPRLPMDFILEIHRINTMRQREQARRNNSSHAGNEHRSAIAARVQA